MKLRGTILLLVAMALVAGACNRGPRRFRPVVDPTLLRMTKEQVWDKAEDQFAKKNWPRARYMS